jgi:RNA polymerase sigma factor (sigma-70 family)
MESALMKAVAKGKNGDRQALTEIYNSTNRMVYFNALKLTQNEEDAQDIVQETYMQAFRSLNRLQDDKAFIKWLKTIVINLSKNYLKKHRPVLFQTDEQEEQVLRNIPEISEEFLPEEYADKKETCRLIMNIVDRLPDAQRTAVLLYYFNELPVEEVAEIMETKDGTIKSRLNYARKKIKEEVEEHEKRGTRLYSIPAIPILARILQNASQEYALPMEASSKILSASLENTGILDGAEAAVPGNKGNTAFRSAPGAAVKASSGLLARFMAAPLAAKITAGIAAAGLLIGGGIGIIQMTGNKEATTDNWRKAYVERAEALEGKEWDDLLGMTREEIVAILGEPDEVREDEDEIVYKDKKSGYELFDINFHEDGTATLISGIVPGYAVKGVRVGDTLEQAMAVFNTIPDAVLEQENDNRGVLWAAVYSIGDYRYSFLYDEEKIIQIVSVSKVHRTTYTSGSEEPAVSEEPAEMPAESQQPAEPSSEPADTVDDKPTPAPSEGNAVSDTYKEYFIKNFSGTNAQAFFADLTHDGRDEMLVAYGDLMEGYLDIYTISNGNVSLIHDQYTATMTNYMYGLGLYEEGGKDYILYFGRFEWQGHPYYFYDIYSLNMESTVSLHKKELNFSYDENGKLVDITQEELDQFNQELDSYARRSQLLVSGANFPGQEYSMDVIYGKGESFREAASADKIALDRLMGAEDMEILKALGNPASMKSYEILYDGLEIYKNYGANDTFIITSKKYSVHGVYVGQSKADALKALDGTRAVKSDDVTGYIFRDTFISDSFDFALVPVFRNDTVTELYYQVYFGD